MHRNRVAVLYSLFLSCMIFLSALTMVDTLAKYIDSFLFTERLTVAEFNVSIFPPEELETVSEESPFVHSFSEKEQSLSFDFSVVNNRQVVIRCTPLFEEEVFYHMIVDGERQESFIVDMGEKVDFTLVVFSDGFKANFLPANLIVQVEQV